MMHRNIVPPIHIHPILLVFMVIAFITGTFTELLVILSIVLFHELGHYTMAVIFKWRVQSIMLWVFGGVMKTDEHGNRPLTEELLVTLAGPLQNIVLFVILQLVAPFSLLPNAIWLLLVHYNTLILLFNLLPIWPLDGGKCLFLMLTHYFSYRYSYQFILGLSMMVCVILSVVVLFHTPFTLSTFFLLLFLLKENIMDWYERFYMFIRFLLKRYQSDAAMNGIRSIVVQPESQLLDVFAHFHREKEHIIYVRFSFDDQRVIAENDCLRYFFDNKPYRKTIGDCALQFDP